MAEILVLANDCTTLLHFRTELLSHLVSKGYQVTLALPQDKRNQAFLEMGCTLEPVSLDRFGRNPWRDIALLFKYLTVIRRLRPAVVLTYTAKPNIFGGIACRITNTPYICNVTGLGITFQNEGPAKWLMIRLQRQGFHGSHRVFFQNGANMAFMRKHRVVSNNAAILPGSGVNLELNRAEPYPPEGESIRFITVSRIRHDKGFDELLEAIDRIRRLGYMPEFHLVGWYEEVSYQADIDRLVAEGFLVNHGSVPQKEVRRLLAYCHCLIHPSHHEGMANAILEAGAIARPCLVSDIPGCREAVEPGVNGYLFHAKGVDSLCDAIVKFLELPYERKAMMGKKGRAKVEAGFDREIVVNRYTDEIAKILKERP